MKIRQVFKASDGTESTYAVLDIDGQSVKVSRDPHPFWAAPAWISLDDFAAVAELDS